FADIDFGAFQHFALTRGRAAGDEFYDTSIDRRLLYGSKCAFQHCQVGEGCHASSFLARPMAARTWAGAVPPMWLRAFTEPSRLSTANTSSSMMSLNCFSSASVSALRSRPSLMPKATLLPTTSCASRN